MTKDRIYQDYLQDILEAMNKAESFIANMAYEEFEDDEKTVTEELPVVKPMLLRMLETVKGEEGQRKVEN